MNDAPTETTPALGASAPATCRTCSAPLAADQRYCLHCGVRVAAPRVDWAAALGASAPGALPPADGGGYGPARPARWAHMLDRIGGPMGAAAVVLVALAVGFLLGQGGSGSRGPATIIQRPPVVNVQGGGAAPSGTSGTADASSAGDAGGSKRGGGKSGGSTAGIPKASGNDNAGGDLNRLKSQPTQQATGGTAPRRDNKPAGGGSSAETIG